MSINSDMLPWQQKNWDFLYSYVKQKRIPSALLLAGANGLGKHSLANRFAYSLLCLDLQDKGFSCGSCRSCQLIKTNTHPDLFQIKPEEGKTTISINQIRSVIADTYLKPQFDNYRVVVIHPADAMTISANNAFLKCLEEPGERTIFILITAKPSKLPTTILSRCQQLSVVLPTQDLVYEWLQGQGIQGNQKTLLNLIKGSLLTTQQVCDENVLRQRIDCFKDWLALAKLTTQPALISEKWQKYPQVELINWLISWVTDLIKYVHTGNASQMCNQDSVEALQELAQQLNLRRLDGYYQRLLISRQQLDTQSNFQMMVEEILVEWQKLNLRNSV